MSPRSPRKQTRRDGDHSYEVTTIGARRVGGDFYHSFLRASWTQTLGFIAGAYLLVNFFFALAFVKTGGVAHAEPRSLRDAFYFSVQTMGTIGYGAMYPESNAANVLVVTESVVSLIITALATGLIFAKFSRPIGRVVFARNAVLSPMDGVPTLMLRMGNERGNSIVEAQARVALMRTVRTAEGHVFYRMVDLVLVRDRSPAVSRSWTILHKVDETSPLFGATPESLAKEDAEVIVTLSGTDDTSYQPVHARRAYEHPDLLWGARHADVLSETPEGNLILDVRRFHDVEMTMATESFPYPRSQPATPAS